MALRQVNIAGFGPFLYDDTIEEHAIEADGSIKSTDGYVLSLTSISFGNSPYTITNDEVLSVNSDGGDITVHLPDAATAKLHKIRIIKNDFSANIITINPNGTDLIGGISKYVLTSAKQTLAIFPITNDWVII